MLMRLTGCVTIALVSYAVLFLAFFLFCAVTGHNTVEALYGAVAAPVLAVATGVLYSWLSAESF